MYYCFRRGIQTIEEKKISFKRSCSFDIQWHAIIVSNQLNKKIFK